MKQALEALEELNKASIGVDAVPLPGEIDTAMDALRAAIEQAEKQGPCIPVSNGKITIDARNGNLSIGAPRQWVGLTDEEMAELHREIKVRLMGTFKIEDIYRAIEAKLKEKNL